MLGNLLGGFIVILVGVNLLPTVADTVADQSASDSSLANVSSAGATILGLVTLFYALGIMSAGVALCIGGLRNAGVM